MLGCDFYVQDIWYLAVPWMAMSDFGSVSFAPPKRNELDAVETAHQSLEFKPQKRNQSKVINPFLKQKMMIQKHFIIQLNLEPPALKQNTE